MANGNNPWLALSTYEEEHAYKFKGRETDTENLLTMLRQNDCVVCYAASGDGKSSLINAGLCPQMRKEGLFPIKLVFSAEEYKGEGLPLMSDGVTVDFDKLVLSKIEEGIETYRRWFIDKHKIEGDYHISFEIEEKYTNRDIPHSLWWKLRTETIQIPFGEYDFIPVLIFDQFEEFLRATWRKDFFKWLEMLCKDVCPDSSIRAEDADGIPSYKLFKLFFSLRFEYVAELDYWCSQMAYIPQVMQNRYFLKPLTKRCAKDIITQQDNYDKLNPIADKLVDYLSADSDTMDNDLDKPCVSPLFLSVVCSSLAEMSVNDFAKFTARFDSDLNAKRSFDKILEEFYKKSLKDAEIDDDDIDEVKDVLEEVLIDSKGHRARLSIDDVRLEKSLFVTKYLNKLIESRLIRSIPLYSNSKKDKEGKLSENESMLIEISHDCLTPLLVKDAQKRKLKKKLKNVRNCLFILALLVGMFWGLYELNMDHPIKEHAIISDDEYVGNKTLSTFDNDTLFINHSYIPRNAFRGNANIKTLYLGDSDTLRPYAFADCPNLSEVHLNGKNLIIGYGAFYNCFNLKTICFSDTCSIEKIDYQFGMPNLYRVVFDRNSSFIESFGKTVVVKDKREKKYAIDNRLTNKRTYNENYYDYDGIINVSITDTNTAQKDIYSNIDVVRFAEVIRVDDLKHYLNNSSKRKQDTRIVLESDFKDHPNHRLDISSIQDRIIDVRFPSVEIICLKEGNNDLNEMLTLFLAHQDSVPYYMSHKLEMSFDNPSLENVYFPQLQFIGTRSFSHSSIEFLELPEAIWTGTSSFLLCKKMREADMPKLLLAGFYSFAGCTMLEKFNAPELYAIFASCFKGCTNLKEINFPKVSMVGEGAFEDCIKLKYAYLPSLKTLGHSAFDGCESLQEIVVPMDIADSIMSNPHQYGIGFIYEKERQDSLVVLSSVRNIQSFNDDEINIDENCNTWIQKIIVGRNVKSIEGGWNNDDYKLIWLNSIDVSFYNDSYFQWRGNLLTNEGELELYAANNSSVYVPKIPRWKYSIPLGCDVERVFLLDASLLWNVYPSKDAQKRPVVYLPYGTEDIISKYSSNGKFESVQMMGFFETLYLRTEYATKGVIHKLFNDGFTSLLCLFYPLMLLFGSFYVIYNKYKKRLWKLGMTMMSMFLLVVVGVILWCFALSLESFDIKELSWGIIYAWASYLLLFIAMLSMSIKKLLSSIGFMVAIFSVFIINMSYISPDFYDSVTIEESCVIGLSMWTGPLLVLWGLYKTALFRDSEVDIQYLIKPNVKYILYLIAGFIYMLLWPQCISFGRFSLLVAILITLFGLSVVIVITTGILKRSNKMDVAFIKIRIEDKTKG